MAQPCHPRTFRLGITVIITSGVVRPLDGGVTGVATVDFINQFKVDYAVLSTHGVEGDGSLLDYDYKEVSVMQAMMANARVRFLGVDHSKFQSHALAEGLLENTVAMIAEKMLRPENEWWTARHEQIKQRNARTVPVLAEHLQPFGTQLNIGTLFAVCAVDFLLFRDNLTGAAGLAGISELKAWADEMNALHPCLAATKPRVSA